MNTPIGWPEAQRICDIPQVREALDKFAADAHEENMLAMVSAIMGHAVTQGRAAGLEEAAAECERMHAIHKNAHTYYGYAASRIRSLFPTTSDAGEDDARDAARYRWMRDHKAYVAVQPHYKDLPIAERTGWTIRLITGNDESMDAAIDAALSSLEVIGKGEKG